jgi:predicted nucleotidyltransferase
MNARLKISKKDVADFCRRWKIAELALFGSALRDDFGPDSDVDVLVSFQPDAEHTLFDMVRMQAELKELFGREVDLVSRRGIEGSRNYLRRNEIIGSAEVFYEA